MRTCPKEEDTLETCDGMNQKNIIFDNFCLENRGKTRKNTKKEKIKDLYEFLLEKKLSSLLHLPTFTGFLLFLLDENSSISKSL